MSTAAIINTKFTLEEIRDACMNLAPEFGWKYTEDMSEFGAYYAPEHSGIIPSFALVDPDIQLPLGSSNPDSQTRHIGGNITVNMKGSNLPWTAWANGLVIGADDKGETKIWTDVGGASGNRIIFVNGQYLKNPQTNETTEDLNEAYVFNRDYEANAWKTSNKDKADEILIGMVQSAPEGVQLQTTLEQARLIEKMNEFGNQGLSVEQQEVNASNYNVQIANHVINGMVAANNIKKKYPNLTIEQIKSFMNGSPETAEIEMEVQIKEETSWIERKTGPEMKIEKQKTKAY